jgi:hypothetical protein
MSDITSSLLRWYYLIATPAFWIADLVWDAPLRASFILDYRLRSLYYAGCVGCGVWMWKQPAVTRVVGMAESLTNFTMTILSIWVPVMNAYEAVANGGAEPALNAMQPINAGISGLFILLSYYSRQRNS